MEMDGMCVALGPARLFVRLFTFSLHLSLRHTTPSLSLSLAYSFLSHADRNISRLLLAVYRLDHQERTSPWVRSVSFSQRRARRERGVSAALPVSNALTAPQTEQETPARTGRDKHALIRFIRAGDVCGVVWFHVYVRTVKTPPSLLRSQGNDSECVKPAEHTM